MTILFLTLAGMLLLGKADGYQVPDMLEIKALSTELLKNYSKYIVPSANRLFNIQIFVLLHSMGEIDEIEQKLSTVIWMYYLWVDESIKWNKSETIISYISLSWNDVWTPLLREAYPHVDVTKSIDTCHIYNIMFYRSDGSAFFDEMRTTQTTCNLDMTHYPFDILTCHIEMFISGRSFHYFNLSVSIREQFSTEAANHGSLTMLNNIVSITGHGKFKIELTFERRPLFILLNILLPIIVLALLTPIVFVLPMKSGEKVGYAITMMLPSISVYMTIVSDHLPQNSQPMPLVSILMFIWYTLDALIVFVVIINTKINTTKETKDMSYFSKKFVIITRKLTCHGSKRKTNDEPSNEPEVYSSEEIASQRDNTDVGDERSVDLQDKADTDRITWQELSHSIDKWCFATSYFLKLSLPVVFFSISKLRSQAGEA